MRVMGLDPSLASFGVAYRLPDGLVWASRIAPPKGLRGAARLIYIESALEGFIDKYRPTMVAYEDYAFGAARRGSRSVFGIGELGGVTKRLLYKKGVAILTVPPSSLKLFATGKGNADKAEVAKYVQQTEGRVFASSDQNDAVALLKLGEAFVTPRMRPRNRQHYQRQALAGCALTE